MLHPGDLDKGVTEGMGRSGQIKDDLVDQSDGP